MKSIKIFKIKVSIQSKIKLLKVKQCFKVEINKIYLNKIHE